MKILYFGTVCETENYNNLLNKCRVKPSVAPLVFENALLDGFYKNNAEVEIHSFPMVPTFPKARLLRFGGFSEKLACGYTCRWLYTINLPVLKQLSRKLSGRRAIKRWCKGNCKDGIILTYSIPPFLAKDVLKLGKKYRVPTAAIVPDLLRDMYINEKPSFVTRLKNWYIKPALKAQGNYDGYVFLTEEMSAVVAPGKPYTVMEGIASENGDNSVSTVEKSTPQGIMYAGMLHEKYGIINLLDAFERIGNKETELWLFGDGTARSEIEKRAESNSRIKYFGTVNRHTVMEYEKKASLLVNPRDPNEAFTKYSFPSKTIEYMLSGTPLLTTRLAGIPREYFDYCFSAESGSTKDLTAALERALSHTAAELEAIGQKARQFVIKNKSSENQGLRVIEFLKEVQDDN